jgi:beta-galactosidase
MPSGSLSDWPPITPSDAACAYGLNLAMGMKGVNYYVFAGGENPPGTGTTCDVYDYGAPVSPAGDIRPLYAAVAGFNRFLDQHRWLASAEQATDCRIGYSLDQSRHPRKLPVDQQMLMPPGEAWSFMRKGLMLTTLCGHWSPQMVDLADEGFVKDTSRPLMVAGSTVMAAQEQRHLVQYLQAGGKLILSPVVPTLDERYRECRILADFLGDIEQKRCSRGAPLVSVGEIGGVLINGALFEFTRLPATARVIARTGLDPVAIGVQLQTPGGGSATLLGFHWRQSRREHERLLSQALLQSGGRPIIECDNPNLWTFVRTDGRQAMLFILNLFSSPMDASIRFRDPTRPDPWHALPPCKLSAMEVQAWTPDAGCVWRSSYVPDLDKA